jgi:hypothetical protein
MIGQLAHVGILRARVDAIPNVSERLRLELVLRDLQIILRLLPQVEGHRLASRARWLRDCLDAELHQRLAAAEKRR